MADNVPITAGAGTSIATDDVGGVQYQRVKIAWGADGAAADNSNATPMPVNIVPNGGQGTTFLYRSSSAGNNGTNIVSTHANLYGIYATNTNAAVRYLRLYDKATGPTVGTDVPVACFAIPGNGGIVIDIANAWRFNNGISISIGTGAADSDTSAILANEVKLVLSYVGS